MKIGKMIALAGLVVAAASLILTGCIINVYPWDDEPEEGIYFSLEWTDNGTDRPHLYVTYPAVTNTTPSGTPPVFSEPYGLPDGNGALGFIPSDIVEGPPVEEDMDGRGTVYFSDTASTYTTGARAAIQLEDSGASSEVILVREFPFYSSATVYNTDAVSGDLTGLDTGDYAWVGVMEAYAYATSGQLAYAGSTSDVGAVLNVFQVTASGTERALASYEIPSNTDVKGASLVRINCFYDSQGFEIYQLVPDIRVLQSDTQIRSVAPGAEVSEDGIITIRRAVE